MDKENHWSRIAGDFEKRVYYVAGKENIEAIQMVLSAQNLSGKVLELGCGNGTYSTTLAEKAERLHVTDLSEQMVCVCKDRLKDLDHVVAEKQDSLALSYPDESFDFVIMVNLLHVIIEPEKALRESRRVLKPNGKLIVISFTTEGMGFLSKIGMTYRYLRAFGKPPAKAKRLTVSIAKSMLEDQGLGVEEARLIGVTSKAIFVRAATKVDAL